MNILHLTLKKKWFDMIASGEKKEEYREIKPYWITRLANSHTGEMGGDFMDSYKVIAHTFKNFDCVSAKNGYGVTSPKLSWQHKGIRIGKPNPLWCDPQNVDKDVFILAIGELNPAL